MVLPLTAFTFGCSSQVTGSAVGSVPTYRAVVWSQADVISRSKKKEKKKKEVPDKSTSAVIDDMIRAFPMIKTSTSFMSETQSHSKHPTQVKRKITQRYDVYIIKPEAFEDTRES